MQAALKLRGTQERRIVTVKKLQEYPEILKLHWFMTFLGSGFFFLAHLS